MITEKDLHEAIAECQGQRNPNASTCIKLAAYYTILDNITENESEPDSSLSYSYAGASTESTINYDGDSEFLQLINGKSQSDVIPILDELMTTLQIVNPRLYNSVVRKL